MSLGSNTKAATDNGWWETAKVIFQALILAMIVRVFFYQPFNIPSGSMKGTLLVGDYFGFGHWRNRNVYGNSEAYGSSEKFEGAGITPGTEASSAFWSCLESDSNISLETLKVKLHAGYVDGHVGCYSPSEAVPMKVSFSPDGSVPYPSWYSTNPGTFYLPSNGLR